MGFRYFRLYWKTRGSRCRKGIFKLSGKCPKEGIGIFFHGSNGTGKTFLGVEVLKEALRQGYTAQFASLGRIIQALTDGWYDTQKEIAL